MINQLVDNSNDANLSALEIEALKNARMDNEGNVYIPKFTIRHWLCKSARLNMFRDILNERGLKQWERIHNENKI